MPVNNPTLTRATLWLLLAGLLTFLGMIGTSMWLLSRTDMLADTLAEVQQVRRAVRATTAAQEAEASQRGYLLTGDANYLEPYLAAVERLPQDLAVLRELGRKHSEHGLAATALESSVAAKMDELRQTVDLARAGRRDEALAIVRSGRGDALMMEIRKERDELAGFVDERLAAGVAATRSSVTALEWVLVLGGALIVAVVAGSAWLAWRYTRALDSARAAVAEAATGLEERVRERTADLARANEEIQRFAYIVSHDLRSPLVNIMGFTSELEAVLPTLVPVVADHPSRDVRAVVQEDMPEAIGFIRASTDKMDKLINAILRLSREGGRRLTEERVDVGEVLSAAAGSVQHQVGESGGEVVVETPVPEIATDRLAVEQIFGNLVDNAAKYLDPGRPGRIVLRGRSVSHGVVYEVEDNGRGIAREDYDRVFDLFRRAGVQDRAGEGIGLSHVRALVRRLGGDIELQSELGRGTTFRVRLPRRLPATESV